MNWETKRTIRQLEIGRLGFSRGLRVALLHNRSDVLGYLLLAKQIRATDFGAEFDQWPVG